VVCRSWALYCLFFYVIEVESDEVAGIELVLTVVGVVEHCLSIMHNVMDHTSLKKYIYISTTACQSFLS